MFWFVMILHAASGWFYGHLMEYLVHRYFLHDVKLFPRFFKRHFGTHHRIARKNEMFDENYVNVFTRESLFEMLGILFLLVLHLPILFTAPVFYGVLVISCVQYYIKHRRSHIDVEWGRDNMPWHYEHHMGKDQHKNWGVRSNIIDRLLEN